MWRTPRSVCALLLAAACGAANADCAAMLAAHERDDLALSYDRFDQSEGSGFRALAMQRCFAQAERLILAYLPTHADHASALWWHAAQMAASAGDYPRASADARHARDTAPPRRGDPLMWDDYLQASIAFFDRDKLTLRLMRDRIAASGMGFQGNRLNVNLLDTMLDEFDADYDRIGADALHKWQRLQASAAASQAP